MAKGKKKRAKKEAAAKAEKKSQKAETKASKQAKATPARGGMAEMVREVWNANKSKSAREIAMMAAERLGETAEDAVNKLQELAQSVTGGDKKGKEGGKNKKSGKSSDATPSGPAAAVEGAMEAAIKFVEYVGSLDVAKSLMKRLEDFRKKP